MRLRDGLVEERIGDGGLDVSAALTETLDRGIAELAADLPSGLAVVAVGGYGRREQCLFSDVDVLVLHRAGDPDVAVRSVLYPLWDSNLRVGHAVRTLRETSQAGRDDFETLTSLLSARLVGGDAELFEDLVGVVTDLIRGRPLASKLAALERQRRDETPYQVMAADLKEGRGALRTHQGLWWERRRASLLGLTVDEPGDDERAAREALMRARNALHAAAGRANDRFVVGLREPAAEWLGTDPYDLAASITAALDMGDRLADRRWPDIHVETDPMVKFGRRIFGAVRSRFSSDAVDGGGEGTLSMAVAAAGRRGGARFTPEEEAAIQAAPVVPWSAEDRHSFELLLSAGARGRAILGRLDELGWVDRELPEWRAVATAPQIAPFHDHPVGAHLHRTVAEMLALIGDRGEYGAIAAEVGSSEELVLAAFLHDIGKARGGDHSVVGADLAASFLRRVGFGPATTATVADGVRLHLLLPEAATRRDIADPTVIDDVAARVGTRHQLDVLYLLAVADLRATGTTLWNPWRASLLRRLHGSVREALEAGAAVPATVGVEEVIAEADGTFDRRAIEEHVAAMPDDYLDTTPPRDVIWHMACTSSLEHEARVVQDPSHPGRVLVVGPDRTGFLLAVSRAFAANAVGVRDARLRTRSDGVAIDTFHVADDRTGDPLDDERWRTVERDLLDALAGARDLRPAVRARMDAYRRTSPSADVDVRPSAEGRFAAIEVRMADGVGVFSTIVEALHGEGLDIHLARVDTLGDSARDVFHVRRVGGGAIPASELPALGKRLVDRLRS